MSLFQPTNIFPDIKNGVGNGTIDATKKLTIQWDVNGNSQMTKYQVQIFLNDATSTLIYDSGKRNDNCPFYGTSYLGEPIPFKFTLSAGQLSVAGIMNGNEYKIIITEWWSPNDSVTLSSAAVFKTRAMPTVSLANPISLTSRNYVFEFDYYQAQGDSLEWARYQIAFDTSNGRENPFYDTGKIYGTANTSVYYNGFLPDTAYCIKCMICTENGMQAETGWISFQANYERTSLPFPITVTPLCDKSAIQVSWTGANNITGVGTGDYTTINKKLELNDTSSSVIWNSVNNDPMSFASPWNIVYHCELQGEDANMLDITMDNGGTLSVSYDNSANKLTATLNGTVVETITGLLREDSLYFLITPTQLIIRRETVGNVVVPQNILYPSNGLVPANARGDQLILYTAPLFYEQGAITSITLGGKQICYYLLVFEGETPSSVIIPLLNKPIPCAYQPEFTDNSVFFASFTVGLQAGNLYVLGEELSGWAIYRQQYAPPEVFEPVTIATLPLSSSTFTDYGLRSDGTKYRYLIAPIMINSPAGGLVPRHDLYPSNTLYPKASNGADTYITGVSVESEIVQLCVWNYTLIEAYYNASTECHIVVSEYNFGKNLSTSDMSNNNSPNVMHNFTPYPTVQLAPQNYKSGSLTSLIGAFKVEDGDLKYYDSRELRDAIFGLSVSSNDLFLKTRKGDVLCVRLSRDISMATMDDTREQALEASISWVEVDEADKAHLLTYA